MMHKYTNALTRIEFASALSTSPNNKSSDQLRRLFKAQEPAGAINARRQLDDEAFEYLKKLHLKK